jgi:hypothetical protein
MVMLSATRFGTRPKFECQTGTKRVFCRNHLGAWQLSGVSELADVHPYQVWDKKKQSAATRREGALIESKSPDIGNGLDSGSGIIGTLLIHAPGQSSKPLLFQDFANRGRAQRAVTLFECFADLVYGMVLLAQTDDQIVGCGLLRLTARTMVWRKEENRIGIPAEMVAENMEGSDGVAESFGDIFRSATFDEIRSECFVHAVLGVVRFEEIAAATT